jgi:hypothetical protein
MADLKPTNQMVHYHLGGGSRPGGGSVAGLQIMLDDNGDEFVHYQGLWTHVDDVPLPKLHREEIRSMTQKEMRRPMLASTQPVVPNLPAFQGTTPEQRLPATKLHPDSPVVKK